MSLVAGTRLGPYLVLAPLGAGGMGEVYRAQDTKLNRTVAIKSLHASVTHDPERVARFEREAQLLASLNHPNIAAIHGLQEVDGAMYLVLEFVEGKTLADVLRATGPMPVDDALPFARQIADAVAAAHERGIIHRDLKPGNVMVTPDGQVKVLDFGLGKSIDGEPSSGPQPSASNSPTMTLGGTQAGIILGTAGYMSPEQAKGRTADKRSDVWSFGCVLFEMLAGTRAFEGEDVTDTLAAIVRGEPEWKRLPATVPAHLRKLLERCLLKDRAQRLSDMSVVRFVLSEQSATEATAPAPPATAASSRGLAWPIVAALIVLTAVATFGIVRLGSRNDHATPVAGGLSRFSFVLPNDYEVAYINLVPVAVAPGGRAIAYVASRAGKIQLFVKEFSEAEPRAIDGTEGARSPFFSPDGLWIGFFARGKLRKVTTGGTAVQDVADAADARGGTWAPDGTIYYAPTNTSGIWRVSANGGAPGAELTRPNRDAAEISHRWPLALADGKTLLVNVWTGPGFEEHRLERVTIADGHRSVLVRSADGPTAMLGSTLVYAGRADSLLATPWQTDGELRSEPVALPFLAALENEGAAGFAASDAGTFAIMPGSVTRRLAQILWVPPDSTSGRPEALPIPDRDYISAALSGDGRRAVVQIRDGVEDLWIYEFATRSFTPLVTPGGSSQSPVWSADGRTIYYRGTRNGFRNLYRYSADGTGTEERLTTKPDIIHSPSSASADGKWLIYTESGISSTTIWRLPLRGDPGPTMIASGSAPMLDGQVSPDGKWLAYESTVSGGFEVWIKPFDEGGASRKVSRDGGTAARWSRDGKNLFYEGNLGIMEVDVTSTDLSTPRVVAAGRYRPASNANTNYDVARDGRFLLVQGLQSVKPQTRIDIILNGLAGIRK